MKLGHKLLIAGIASAATLALGVPAASAAQVRYSGVLLQNQQTGQCMWQSGAYFTLGSCNFKNSGDKWNIFPDDGYNEIQNNATGECVYDYNAEEAPDRPAMAQMKECAGNPNVLWNADPSGDGQYLFQNNSDPAECLDATGHYYINNMNTDTPSYCNTWKPNQEWNVLPG